MLNAQDEAVAQLQHLLNQLKNHHIAAYLGIISILTIISWNFVPAKLKIIPGPLVAVLVATAVAVALSLPVLYVEIPDDLREGIHYPLADRTRRV